MIGRADRSLMPAHLGAAVIGAGAFVAPAPAHAEVVVVEFEHSFNRDAWFAAAGPVTTIGFTGLPNGTFITDQYHDEGVLFLDGNDNIVCCDWDGAPQDGAGLDGNAAIHLDFLSAQRWIAADYPGALGIDLYSQGDLLYTSSGFGFSGVGFFAGLISMTPFDEAILYDWAEGMEDGQVNLDDLHFGWLPVGDFDADGVVTTTDLLALLAAWGPCPEPCPRICEADLTGDDRVRTEDFLALLEAWGPNPGHPADLDGNGVVDTPDMLTLLGQWGNCPVFFPPTCQADLDTDCDVGTTDLLTLLASWAPPP